LAEGGVLAASYATSCDLHVHKHPVGFVDHVHLACVIHGDRQAVLFVGV
jgi:hypothetical protein